MKPSFRPKQFRPWQQQFVAKMSIRCPLQYFLAAGVGSGKTYGAFNGTLADHGYDLTSSMVGEVQRRNDDQVRSRIAMGRSGQMG